MTRGLGLSETESSKGILDGVLAPPPVGTKQGAGPSIRLAYALADQPMVPLYTPTNYYSYAGGGIRVKRIGVGHYAVEFDKVSNVFWGGTENVITTAVGYSRLQCGSDFWFSSATEDKLSVRVDCIEMATGLHQDSPFSILVVGSGSLLAPSAFAIGSQPSTASYTPDPAYSYGTGAGAKLITHNALPGDWNADVRHTPLCISCTPTATITGGSFLLATALDSIPTLVTGTSTSRTVQFADGDSSLSAWSQRG